MYQSLPLDQIRQKIDSLDNQIHDLLLERADLIMAISEEKKKAGIQIVQPAREARMIRRLMARHRGPLPEETIVRIWRELVSSVSLLQTGLSVAVYTPAHTPEYWDMARDYFGTVLPMERVPAPDAALDAVKQGRITFAVLPYPGAKGNADDESWWVGLVDSCLSQEGLSVIQKLPYGEKENFDFHQHPALVVAKAGFGESDDDHSLIGAKSRHPIDRSAVKAVLDEAGKTVNLMIVKDDYILIDVSGHITKSKPEFASWAALLQKAGLEQVTTIGGYPAPLTYHNE